MGKQVKRRQYSRKCKAKSSRGRPPVVALKVKTPKKTVEPNRRHQNNQKRRKSRRISFTLFSTGAVIKSRPAHTLTVQTNYALKTVPEKLQALKDGGKSCSLKCIHELEKLETNLLARLDLVSNLKLDDDAEEDLVEGKYQVISELEDKLLLIQQLHRLKNKELKKNRIELIRQNHNRFVCCQACAKNV